jgi:hypothetical protein
LEEFFNLSYEKKRQIGIQRQGYKKIVCNREKDRNREIENEERT